MLSVEAITRALSTYWPSQLDPAGRSHAAVALLLRPSGSSERDAELLFIERAERAGDPWSGHMAFPGGRVETGDRDVWAAAERETLEEVGISLDRGRALGRLADLEGRAGGRRLPLVISAFVYRVGDVDPVLQREEVRAALWVPLRTLLDSKRHTALVASRTGVPVRYPGIVVGDSRRHVVWGLTYRFLEQLLDVAGHPLPDRWPRGEPLEDTSSASETKPGSSSGGL